MKASEITLDTTSGEIIESIENGEMTWVDWRDQAPRLRRESAERRSGAEAAIDAAKTLDATKGHNRRAVWRSRYVIGGDKSRFYLVTCGRASWHVNPESHVVTVVHGTR